MTTCTPNDSGAGPAYSRLTNGTLGAAQPSGDARPAKALLVQASMVDDTYVVTGAVAVWELRSPGRSRWSVGSSGKEVQHEPVEVVRPLDRREVGGTGSSDDFQPGARDGFRGLTRYPGRGEQVLFAHDYQGGGGDSG